MRAKETNAKTNTPEIADRMRKVLEAARLSFGLEGAVLYGSAARGEAGPDSDTDLLVVGRTLPIQRHRRSRETLEVKRLLPGVPLDVALMTVGEVLSNFHNHNPLFLDIAEDGIILLDPHGILRHAAQETLRYIQERGIERVEGGWRFPTRRGTPTYLSRVSNADFALAMLKDATRDHRIGQRLIEDGFYDKAVYHFQQAAEKSVKAMLIALGVFKKTHLVGAVLRGICGEGRIPPEWKGPLLQAAEHSEELEPDVSLSRYPGIVNDALWLPFEEYAPEDARSAEAKSAETLETARKFVRDWFSDHSD